MSDISENSIGGRPASTTSYPAPQPSPSDTAADKLSELKDKAADDFTQIRQAAETQAQAAMDMTAEKATEQKNFIAGQLSSIAQALEKAGFELERDNQQSIGKYTRDLGDSAKRIAEDIRDRDIGEVAAIAEDFGRKQPVAFLGLAALAGFAASRFVTASAQRRPSDKADAYATGRSTTSPQQGMPGADTSVSNTNREGGYNG